MPSKKKPRPLFEVPIDIGTGRESGWVYRSGASETAAPAPVSRGEERPGAGAESARALAFAIATVAQTFVLVVTIAVIPLTIGIRALQSLAGPDESRD